VKRPLLQFFRSQYSRRKRKLEADIAEVRRAYAPSLKGKTGEDLEMELRSMHAETEWEEAVLEELETQQVEKKAKRWLITIEPSFYDTDVLSNNVLYKYSREKVLRMVRDARRENIKWWVGVVTPILGAVTGILGTIIGLLAFLKKR